MSYHNVKPFTNMSLASLLEKENEILKNIGKNRKTTNNLVSNNRHLRSELNVTRSQIVDYVNREMAVDKISLYQVVKKNLGVIDKRFNKIYDLIRRTG